MVMVVQGILPESTVFPFQIELIGARDLDGDSLQHLRYQKSLLWVYGGHPSLPSSADLYWKKHKLLSFCEFVWPTKARSWEQGLSCCFSYLLTRIVNSLN